MKHRVKFISDYGFSSPPSSILSDIEHKEYVTEAIICQESPLIGKSVENSGLREFRGMRLLDVIRGNQVLPSHDKELILEVGDRLVLS